MLILTRRSGEEIMIGDEVRVAVLDVKNGGSVRIGIEAPKHVRVLRSELERDDVIGVASVARDE